MKATKENDKVYKARVSACNGHAAIETTPWTNMTVTHGKVELANN